MSRTLSVLHVAQPLEAGVPRCVALLVADQLQRGWSVAVASPPASDLARSAAESGALHISWPATRQPGPRVFLEVRRLARVVRERDPDVVHLHSSKAGLAGRLALRGARPTIFQPHAWSFEAAQFPSRPLAMRWERLAARWSDVTVCVSRQEQALGAAAGISVRWRVVPNGVDLSRWRDASATEQNAARRKLGRAHTATVVCVGRLSRQKGQDRLLDAWPRVLNDVPDARLALVGDGPDLRKLEARRVPGVEFVGRRNDVDLWLAAADVVVVPSRWEGMSLVMLEAMARGCCVVSTNIAGASEALAEGAGAVVPLGDGVSLARAVVERLTDGELRRVEGRAARRRAESLFSHERMAQGIAETYEEVLARRASQGGRAKE